MVIFAGPLEKYCKMKGFQTLVAARLFHQKMTYMKKNNAWLTLVGFLLAGTGLLALFLSLVGVQLSFLVWIDRPGPLFGFVTRLVMIIVGFILIYLAQTDFSGGEEYDSNS